MYSRPHRQDLRVPSNYGGSVFDKSRTTPTPVENLTHNRPNKAPDTYEECEEPSTKVTNEEANNGNAYEACGECERREECDCEDGTRHCPAPKKQTSLFAPFGALGSEEILLIALALIIFQNGNEPELALILLALLFI